VVFLCPNFIVKRLRSGFGILFGFEVLHVRGQRLFPDDLLNQDGKNKLKKNIK
jgi:hypothetical protein